MLGFDEVSIVVGPIVGAAAVGVRDGSLSVVRDDPSVVGNVVGFDVVFMLVGPIAGDKAVGV